MTPWLKIAFEEMDTCEVTGPGANPKIVGYHSITTLKATSDEVPWCASFVGWCLEKGGIKSTKSAAARSYEDWGIAIAKPVEGCIVILSRGADPRNRHVGFYVEETDRTVAILGGNQDNRVKIAPFNKSRVIGYRWPFDQFINGKTSSNPTGNHKLNS